MDADALSAGVTVTYRRQYRRCGKAGCAHCGPDRSGHGPYWYAYWREDGKRRSRYLGRIPPPGVDDAAHPPHQAYSSSVASPADAPPLQVRTLGAFVVWRYGRRIPDAAWRNRRAGDVINCLLAAPNYRLARDQVAEALWPNLDPEASSRNLRQALHQVRQALGSTGHGADAADCLRVEGDMLVLAPDGDGGDQGPAAWLDAAAFAQAATRALAHRDLAEARAALPLYTGIYLPDDDGMPWTDGPRHRLGRQYEHLLLHLADLAGVRGEMVEAEEYLRTLLATDPLHEDAVARLMIMLAAQGKHVEALRVYQALAQAMERDLETVPSREVQDLRSRLLAEAATPRAAERPPRHPISDRPTNLPAPLTSFIGRAWEREEIRQILRGAVDGLGTPCRLLTLSGPGGVGKTRLALEVAEALVDASPDGVWVVDLGATTARDADDGEPVAQAIMTVLGVQEEVNRSRQEMLAAFLRPRRLLLLLDTCEHLARACAALVTGLLRACPGLTIVATSRAALGVPGEVIWTVPPLSVPPEEPLAVTNLLRYEAVQLFVARGRASQRRFTFTERNAAAVAHICRQVDGIPLAIELAAARLDALGVEEVAARLADCFRLLRGGSRAALPRQRTLRASLEWSESLLDAAERALLRRLAVFTGGWTLDAAEMVCGGDPIQDGAVASCLAHLVRHSLVLTTLVEEPTRYRLLEPIRHYAADRLAEAGEETVLRDRAVAYYTALAEEAERPWDRATLWAARLDAEYANIRAAVDWTIVRADGQGELRLALALAWYWQLRGYGTEGRRILRSALAHTPAAASAQRASALQHAGMMAFEQADMEEARQLSEEALALYRVLGDETNVPIVLLQLGHIPQRQGDYAAALASYQECLEVSRRLDDRWLMAHALNSMGLAAMGSGALDDAMVWFAESLTFFPVEQQPIFSGLVLSNQGLTAIYQEDYTAAASFLARAFELHGEPHVAPASYIGLTTANHGLLLLRQQKIVDALRALRQALALQHKIGDTGAISETLTWIAEGLYALGESARAVRLYGAAEALRDRVGVVLDVPARRWYAAALTALRAQCAPGTYAATWAEGRRLSIEEVVEQALT